MAVDVKMPGRKEKKSALETAATITSIGSNIYGMADKAGAFNSSKPSDAPKVEPKSGDFEVGLETFERKKPPINYTPR